MAQERQSQKGLRVGLRDHGTPGSGLAIQHNGANPSATCSKLRSPYQIGPRPHTPTLFTLGYEGLVLDAFIARLQAAQVKTVVDVRELPLSRKKGFSKISILLSIASHWWRKR
ncbi:DUF488 family protein [Rhodoferax lithotrophicus]|uniref:DUF488 family protein n=1 Tax=Rhodoferax lithotrophicus TaxID=2798804 RepID=UPI0029390025|nr:DUF488 family protein [Rhodoferax sp. MIZ03]